MVSKEDKARAEKIYDAMRVRFLFDFFVVILVNCPVTQKEWQTRKRKVPPSIFTATLTQLQQCVEIVKTLAEPTGKRETELMVTFLYPLELSSRTAHFIGGDWY
mgnify:CR=1 FL=1